MKASVRVVCGGCLRSVELSIAEADGEANRCPYCGGVIESPTSRIASPSEDDEASTLTAAAAAPELGQTIDWAKTWERGSLGSLGRFQLRERLGDGGFGQVFRAYDPRLDRDVAIKVLKRPNPSERIMERFFREARAVARLDHPNIVPVHDAGFDNGRCWVAYQLIQGRPLSWYREHNRLDVTTVARMIRGLSDAIDHSHQMGVVHRDLKPANVLVDGEGRPRLIDFGLARRSDFESDLTREGAIVGTPAYMSPEQALGRSRQVDERSDVYSLGVIFSELLYGRRPDEPSADSDSSQPEKPGSAPVDPAVSCRAQSDSAIPAALKSICAKATARDPAERYPTARALIDDLDLWIEHQKTGGYRLGATAPRMLTAAAGALVIACAVAAALIGWSARPRPLDGGPLPVSRADLTHKAAAVLQPARAGTNFIGNRDTGRYHLSTCHHVRSTKPVNRVALESADAAAAQGFRPCKDCLPDAPAHLRELPLEAARPDR